MTNKTKTLIMLYDATNNFRFQDKNKSREDFAIVVVREGFMSSWALGQTYAKTTYAQFIVGSFALTSFLVLPTLALAVSIVKDIVQYFNAYALYCREWSQRITICVKDVAI